MKKVKELTHKQLRPQYAPELLRFKTTDELPDLTEIIGQPRAVAALEFGINIHQPGYHIFAFGPAGVGKHQIVQKIIKNKALLQPTPNDWCYVYNFQKPEHPLAMALPPGTGTIFQKEMKHLVEDLSDVLPPALDFEAAAIKALFEPLKKKYQPLAAVSQYLNDVENDLICHAENNFKQNRDFNFYVVNVLVDHSTTQGAPIIYESHPTTKKLFGTLTSSFNKIQAGALHRANGGYLLLDMKKLKLLKSWETLKDTLTINKITVESPEKTIFSITLQPCPIPLDIKIILLGERSLYHNLCEEDPEFLDLFKVAAEFEDQFERNPKNEKLYARLIATLARQEKLRSLDRLAVMKIIEQGCRLLEDSKKLSIHLNNLLDLLYESNYWAEKVKHKIITGHDVQRAVDTEIYRINRPEAQAQEDFERKFVLLDTKGESIGQINALTVVHEGNFAYGRPARITAIARIGRVGEIINIEREIELSDSIHSKGIFILTGFLRNRYAKKQPLSVFASITFEQLYENIEGDSASMAELCALLSSLANVPIKQSFAVTGSINQNGEIQAIGYVNEKIEGFFDVCKTKGFTGKQGVLIPESNIDNVLLKDEIIHAVAAKKFHIYPIKTIDEAMTILTGIPAGKRSQKGKFPQHSINGKVERCLYSYAQEVIEEHNE